MKKSLNKNIKIPLAGSLEKIIGRSRSECNGSVPDGKVLLSKKQGKTYRVTITYIQLTDEEAKNKRAIIESIMKKNYKK